jgi:hypothetical protein
MEKITYFLAYESGAKKGWRMRESNKTPFEVRAELEKEICEFIGVAPVDLNITAFNRF